MSSSINAEKSSSLPKLALHLQNYFGAPDQIASVLGERFQRETLNKGELHTSLSSYRCKLSFIVNGHLRVFRQTEAKEVTQWIASEGEFITDLNALFFGEPSRWNIQALNDCELYSIDSMQYQHFVQDHPEWRVTEQVFLSKCFITLEERVFSLLSMSAEERYQYFYSQKKELFHQVPQQYLASLLGMTPETFSRIRAKLL